MKRLLVLAIAGIAGAAFAQLSIDQGARKIKGNLTVDGTTTLTGAATLTGTVPTLKATLVDAGNVNVAGRIWTGLADAGAGYVANNLGVGGTAYITIVDAGAAHVANNLGVGGRAAIETLDAGAACIANNLTLGGTAVGGTKIDLLDAGRAHINGPLTVIEGLSSGHCTLNAGSPATCTDTVQHGTVLCVCSNVTYVATPPACTVSGTTMTATGANGASNEVNWHCF